ncbi:hypothetical protein JCM19232_1456 [Vibrio ishigakensis]|uniref:Sulfotransferase domain-containing protein n=1 Tax=Vibrio ishigakensis TaxID=1481914 RepID=A0A0B8PKS8_9VIBR|nr:hypothetical protein JCM19232_1456 [Vibrio ishigakensis]
MIYLHIGLHKTGTTSLQRSVFPKIKGKDFIGRFNGPKEQSTELYTRLSLYIHSKCIDKKSEQILHLELYNLEVEGKDIILSDEWITSDYSEFFGVNGGVWQVKLEKISRIVTGLQHRVLVSLRDPVEGFYSQYIEFKQVGIERKYSSFLEYVNKSNDRLAYEYNYLDILLKKYFNKVYYFLFDELIDKDFTKLKEFLETGCIPDVMHVNRKLDQEGRKKVKNYNYYYETSKRLLPTKFINTLRDNLLLSRFINAISTYFNREKEATKITANERSAASIIFKKSIDFYQGLK